METHVKADRKYKDALFTFIFGNEKHKEFALSLYNALNHSCYTDTDDLEIVTLDQVLLIKMRNDAAFLFQNELNLFEQQSSWNPNIPYRFLEYAVGEYQRYLEKHRYNKYSRRMFQLPAPHFIVFYNGTEKQPEESTLRLSDMFTEHKKGDLEATVHVYNINENYSTGLKAGCEAMYEYCWLTEKIRKGMEPVENKRDERILGKVVEDALHAMPESFLIRRMLMEEMEEVKGMIFGEYDEALYKQEQEKYLKEETEIARATGRKEGRNEGRKEGRKEGIKEGRKEGIKEGAKQKAIEIADSTLRRFPDWSDQEIAAFVKDLTAEEVGKLRRGENLNRHY